VLAGSNCMPVTASCSFGTMFQPCTGAAATQYWRTAAAAGPGASNPPTSAARRMSRRVCRIWRSLRSGVGTEIPPPRRARGSLGSDDDLPVHVRAVDAADVLVGAGRGEPHLDRRREVASGRPLQGRREEAVAVARRAGV